MRVHALDLDVGDSDASKFLDVRAKPFLREMLR